MQFYHYFLLFIKAIVTVQLGMIFIKKQSSESKLFIITDTIFKISIALFVISYFYYLNKDTLINYHEKSFFVAAGVLLLLDVDYIKFYDAVTKW